jgi:transposase-like protein/IS1 family transposase
MILATCQHETTKPVGKDRKGNQRLRCTLCGKYMLADRVKPLGDMRISMRDACAAIKLLVKGMSIRDTADVTGLNKDTVCDLILTVGENCARLMQSIRGVAVKNVECDEIWSFVGMKERTRVAAARSSEWGDSWTFIALESNTKLVLTYAIGQRDMATSVRFLKQLDRATSGRFQLSTDGLGSYTLNAPFVLGSRVDFAQVVKNFASTQTTVRYSPAKISGIDKFARFGNPDMDRCSTSMVERFNLTLRMSCRRHTRLTNAHSKSARHHAAMQAIVISHYNWCRSHETLKGRTPAMAAGLANKAWSVCELFGYAAAA